MSRRPRSAIPGASAEPRVTSEPVCARLRTLFAPVTGEALPDRLTRLVEELDRQQAHRIPEQGARRPRR